MAQGQIDNLLSKEALQSFVDLRVLVDGNVTSLEKLIARAVDLNKSIGGNIGFKQFNDQIKAIEVNEKALADQTVNLASAQGKLTSTIESYSKTISSNIDAQKEVAKIVKQSVANALNEAKARKLNAEAALLENKAITEVANAKLKEAQVTKTVTQEREAGTRSIIAQDREIDRLIALEEKEIQSKEKLAAATQKANAATTEIVPTTVSNNTADNAKTGTVVNDGQTAALNEQLAAQAALNTEINASTAARSGANAQTAKAVVLEEQLAKSEIQLEAAQSDNNVHLQENKILTKEATDLAKRQALENLGLLGAYDKLVLKYKEASIAAKDLAASETATQAEVKAAADNALALGNRVKAIDETVGQSQKNVGNYASAFGKAFGSIRQLAYILPGIGIAGIFSAIFDGITALVEKLNLFSSTQSKVNESFEKSSEAVGKEVGALQAYYAITQNSTIALGERQKATAQVQEIVEKNNKATGETTSLLVNQNGVLGDNKIAIEAVTQSLIQQAKTQGLVAAIGAAYSKLIRDQNADLSNFDKYVGGILRGFGDASTFQEAISAIKADNVKDDTKALGGLQKALEDLLSTGKGKLVLPKPDTAGNSTRFAQIKAEGIEELKIREDLQKRLSEVESLDLQTRINARTEAANTEDLINSREYQAAIKNAQAKFSASKKELVDRQELYSSLAQAQDKAEGSALANETKYEEDLISVRQSAIARQKDLDKKANDDALAAFADANSKRLKAIQDQSASQQTNLAGGKDIEVEALNRKYDAQYKAAGDNQKKITALDLKYAVERGNIEFEYAKNSLKDQISTAEELIQFEKDNNQSTLSEEEKLSKAKQDLSDLELKHALENNEKRRQSEKQTLADIQKGIEFVQDIGDRVLSIIGGLVDANVTRIKNSLQDQSDQIDKNTAKEISAAEASGDTAQNKANRIAVINAKAQAQKDLLDIKQRQADEKKARFDKAQTIFGIITKTALAVVSFLAQTNFIGAQLAAVLGAAELAVAIAAPLPRYKGGTWDHLGTDAIVGDGGKRELVIEPSGKMYATPDVPTVMNLPKHSIVLPDLQKVLENGIMSPWRGGSVVKSNDEELLKGIKREIALLRQVTPKHQDRSKINHRGYMALSKAASNYWKYIDDNINF